MSQTIIKTKAGLPDKKFLFCIDNNITESRLWYDSGGLDSDGFRDSISLELIYIYLFFVYNLNLNEIIKLDSQECINLYNHLNINKTNKNNFDIIFDIGAHHGHFTINFSQISSQVISIEPYFYNFEILLKNIEINKLSNVKCLNYFVSSHNKNLIFDKKDWIRFNNDTIHQSPEFSIKSIKLDDFYDCITSNSLIKIDTEGEEIQILKGFTKTLLNKKPNLVIELHDFSVDCHDELKTLINFNEYEILKLNRKENKIKKYDLIDNFADINWLFFRKL